MQIRHNPPYSNNSKCDGDLSAIFLGTGTKVTLKSVPAQNFQKLTILTNLLPVVKFVQRANSVGDFLRINITANSGNSFIPSGVEVFPFTFNILTSLSIL